MWTADDERGFFRALSAVKTRDPKIYDNNVNFFKEKEIEENDLEDDDEKSNDDEDFTSSNVAKRRKTEKMTLRDYERKLVVERGGLISDDDSEEAQSVQKSSNSETYAKVEERLKQEFKNLLDTDSDSDGELLTKRIKTDEQQKAENDDFYEWLRGGGSLEVFDEDLQKLRKRWSKAEELDNDELFLRDYLLEKKYENLQDDEANPSYEDIIREEEDEEKVEEFEHKYNFRFEEPDQDFIKQYPRTVRESVRNSKSRRRKNRLEKKQAEKELLKKILNEPESEDDSAFRFRYRTVPANDFGLTTDEILKADDKNLNLWVSVKKVCAYRSNEEEQRDIGHFQRLAQNMVKKKKIFQESEVKVKKTTTESENNSVKHKKRKLAKNKTSSVKTKIKIEENQKIESQPIQALVINAKEEIAEVNKELVDKSTAQQKSVTTANDEKTKRKRHKKKEKQAVVEDLNLKRLQSYGVRTKKLKRLLYNKKQIKREAEKQEKVKAIKS